MQSLSCVTIDLLCRFFCALHPDMRASWGEAWQRNLRPGGSLITMMFPMEPEGREGPPWPVSKQAYADALVPVGFECVKEEPVAEADATTANRAGREVFAIWKLRQDAMRDKSAL